jgi:hypothetical protein
VDVLDSGGVTLDTRTVSAFQNGIYLIWDLSGTITLRFTNTSSNICISGFFFDGAAVTAGAAVTQEHTYVAKQVDNTQSISAENADVAASPSNVQDQSTEHVIVSGWPTNAHLLTQMFVVVATHDAPPVPTAHLTVNKTVAPAGDPGKFNLLIDSNAEAFNVGDGGSTGSVEVEAGPHVVSESAGTDTDLSDYDSVIGGDAAPDGSVTLAAGESKTVTITNTRKPAPPEPPGPPAPSGCPPAFTLRRVAVTLRRTTNLPVRGADN